MAKVAVSTVARFDAGEELKERTAESIRAALERAGVEFTKGEAPCVRLREDTRRDDSAR